MNHTLRRLAVLAGLAAAASAHAQSQPSGASSVTLYGLIDNGIENLTNAAPGGGSANRLSSGGMNNSRFGFRGSEDLGGGLKALFNLEAGLLTDTGASDGVLFKRQATVGLEGGFGRVVAGRSFTTVYDFIVGFDPLAYAPYYSWASSGSASGATSYSMTTAADNLVKYAIETGPLKFGATYAFGEQTSGKSDGAKMQGGVIYTPGPVSLVATYEQANGNNVAATNRHDKTTVLHLGGMYTVGDFKLQLVGRAYKSELNDRALPELRANTYWAGVTWKATPAMTLTGTVFYTDVRNVAAGADADPVMYVARVRYALSKRTDVYLTGAYAKAKHDKLISLSRNDVGGSDNQRGLMAGIQHRF